MSPDMLGFLIGVVFVVPTICIANKTRSEKWVWPFFLATLPLFYMIFGLLVVDEKVIQLELLYGLPYILIGLLLLKVRFPFAHVLIGVAWLSHGFYDYYHDLLFVNPGVFSWYPVFCAVVDIAIGGYLLINGRKFRPVFEKN